MPLLNTLTDLKSLKYGQDRPGGGSSGQPYIQFPLPEQASEEVKAYYENNKYSLDFPLRGGGYNIGMDGPYVGQAAKYDRLRIQKFLRDSPRGPIYILKQQALQLSNPKIQVGSQINLDLGVLPFKYLGNLETTRIYNEGKNTLMQVGVQGSGIHFDRHGIIPVNPYQSTYAYVVAEDFRTNNADNNRLKLLYDTKILNSGKIPLSLGSSNQIEKLNALGISRDSRLLLQYPGGPTSAGGFGFTTVHRYDNTALFDQNVNTQADYFILKGNTYKTSYNSGHTKNYVEPLSYEGRLNKIPELILNYIYDTTGIDIPISQFDLDGIKDRDNSRKEIGTKRLEYLYNKLFTSQSNSRILYSYDKGPGGQETVLHRYDNTVRTSERLKTQARSNLGFGGLAEVKSKDPNEQDYYNVVSGIRTQTKITPAPGDELVDTSVTTGSINGISISTDRLQYLYEKLLVESPSNPITLYKYNGGPGGTETVLRRYDYTDNPPVTPRTFNYTYNYKQLKEAISPSVIGDDSVKDDFRITVNENLANGSKIASTKGYKGKNNIAKKYGVGSPGSPSLNREDYSKSVNSVNAQINTTQDLINKYDLKSKPGDPPKDIIDFHFETIEYGKDPTYIALRAFITSLQDNHSAEYTPFKYVGRGENFYVYNGFTRQISFNFSVAAQSRSEMKPLYRKVNYLLSQLYPDYKSGTGFMRTPMVKLTIGDYIHSQPGFLTSMNVSLNENATWEIVADPKEKDDDMYQLPQSMDITCQFTPIHDFLPRRSVSTNGEYYVTPLIARNDYGRNKFGIGNINLIKNAK